MRYRFVLYLIIFALLHGINLLLIEQCRVLDIAMYQMPTVAGKSFFTGCMTAKRDAKYCHMMADAYLTELKSTVGFDK